MRTPRLVRTAAFRLALFYAGLFAVGSMVLVAFFDLTVSNYARLALRGDLAAESELLLRTAPHGDADGAARLVRERERALGDRQFRYLVTAPDGRIITGDLPLSAARLGRSEVLTPAPSASREFNDESAEISTLGVALPGGGLLVVGRSTYAFHELRETMVAGTIASAALITLMSLAVALLIGRQFLSRIDRVSAAAANIMEGHLGKRLPAIGMGDEFDRLAVNLNAMLDRIQDLMDGLRQVSSDVAHDLRTPLTRLRRRLEDALADAADNPDRDLLVRQALGQVDEILATFNALLRIAQVEAGASRTAFKPIDLSELLERVRQVYEPAAEDEKKQMLADLAPEVWIAGDEELLTQLVSNLIENAITHAPEGATIGLRLKPDGAWAVLEISDEGPGVPEDEREKVFRRFYRLDRSRTSPGAGLGLALVQAIIQLHGGRIELSDNHPGLVVRAAFPRNGVPKLENR